MISITIPFLDVFSYLPKLWYLILKYIRSSIQDLPNLLSRNSLAAYFNIVVHTIWFAHDALSGLNLQISWKRTNYNTNHAAWNRWNHCCQETLHTTTILWDWRRYITVVVSLSLELFLFGNEKLATRTLHYFQFLNKRS